MTSILEKNNFKFRSREFSLPDFLFLVVILATYFSNYDNFSKFKVISFFLLIIIYTTIGSKIIIIKDEIIYVKYKFFRKKNFQRNLSDCIGYVPYNLNNFKNRVGFKGGFYFIRGLRLKFKDNFVFDLRLPSWSKQEKSLDIFIDYLQSKEIKNLVKVPEPNSDNKEYLNQKVSIKSIFNDFVNQTTGF
ncbi:MAG: hypothetical protein V4439_02640 [Patescibacteria group bacterium]